MGVRAGAATLRERGSDKEISGGFCCSGPPARRFPLLLPGAVRPRFCLSNLVREDVRYAAIASASLSLALMSFERFYGAFRPGESIRFSAHVDPRSAPSDGADGRENRPLCPPDLVEPPGTAPGSIASIIHRSLSP